MVLPYASRFFLAIRSEGYDVSQKKKKRERREKADECGHII